MKILSVDWDYFFPNLLGYDWGHREGDVRFQELLWFFRVYNRNMLTGKFAIDEVQPSRRRLYKFWERVCTHAPKELVIVDSHQEIYDLCMFHEVYNFDAHHDLYDEGKLSCENWARLALINNHITKYVLIYPPWHRKLESNDKHLLDLKGVEVFNRIPRGFPHKFDRVFICRSSAWTPPWCDKSWLRFIGYWQIFPDLWNTRLTCDFVQKKRNVDFEHAKRLKEEIAKLTRRDTDGTDKGNVG
jgi:hypothetical protein